MVSYSRPSLQLISSNSTSSLRYPRKDMEGPKLAAVDNQQQGGPEVAARALGDRPLKRDPACVECRQRKLKCDRKYPCSECITVCTVSCKVPFPCSYCCYYLYPIHTFSGYRFFFLLIQTLTQHGRGCLAPPPSGPRKPRRQNHHELRDKLASIESLLEECMGSKPDNLANETPPILINQESPTNGQNHDDRKRKVQSPGWLVQTKNGVEFRDSKTASATHEDVSKCFASHGLTTFGP